MQDRSGHDDLQGQQLECRLPGQKACRRERLMIHAGLISRLSRMPLVQDTMICKHRGLGLRIGQVEDWAAEGQLH